MKQVYDSIYASLDTSNISYEERQREELLQKEEFTYGEIEFLSFLAVLDTLQPLKNEKFYDIGCGAGRALVAVTLAWPCVRVTGIELLGGLAAAAERCVKGFG